LLTKAPEFKGYMPLSVIRHSKWRPSSLFY